MATLGDFTLLLICAGLVYLFYLALEAPWENRHDEDNV